jgi:hypothetical protein
MIGTEPTKKVGRPKKQRIVLDTSMTVAQADEQKKIADAKERMYKAQIARINAEKAANNVIDTKIVVNMVTDVFSKMKSLLYSASNKLPSQIVGKSHAEVTQIMFQFIDETLSRCVADFDNKISNLKQDENNIEEDLDTDE